MRVGIIGAGSMGTAHARGWAKTDAEIVGVADIMPEKAEALASKHGWRAFPSMDAILPNVDIVDICLPTHLHYEKTLQAAHAGKHIMCEKPIALNVARGKEMIAVCNAQGVRLFIGMVVRFFPEYQAAHRAIRAGQIGAPGVIRLTRAGFRPQRAADDWFMDPERSGGMIVDLPIHDFDQARWLAGDEVVRVFAKSISGQIPGVLDDHVLAILRFRNGAMAHVEGSWAYPVPMFVTRAEIAGDAGLIEFDSSQTVPIRTHLHRTGDDKAYDVPMLRSPLADDPWETEVIHFWNAIKHNTPFAVTPEDALAALQIALAARESARTGKPVTLEPLEVA